MWRCLFMAVGIFAIILGLESMVVDQVLMTNKRRLSKIIAAKTRELSNPDNANRGDRENPYQLPNFQGNSGTNSYGYTGSQSGSFNRMIERTRNAFRGQTNYGNAGYSNSNNFDVPTYRSPAPRRSKPQRVVKMRDWMPWSLLATGTIIILYSHSYTPRGSSE